MSVWLSTLKYLALTLIGGTGALGVLLYSVQTKLIYPSGMPQGTSVLPFRLAGVGRFVGREGASAATSHSAPSLRAQDNPVPVSSLR